MEQLYKEASDILVKVYELKHNHPDSIVAHQAYLGAKQMHLRIEAMYNSFKTIGNDKKAK